MTQPLASELSPAAVRASASVARVVRVEGSRVLATLTRTVGDLHLAEDAVQDAVVAALERWPTTGVPDNPRAWLTAVARNRAIDVLRREARREGKEAETVRLLTAGDDDVPDSVVRDDLLRLVFTCCHPALGLDAQVALSLRTLCGLSVAQVARALILPEATVAKRLTRAKQKIARAGIPYRVPRTTNYPTGSRASRALCTSCSPPGTRRPGAILSGSTCARKRSGWPGSSAT